MKFSLFFAALWVAGTSLLLGDHSMRFHPEKALTVSLEKESKVKLYHHPRGGEDKVLAGVFKLSEGSHVIHLMKNGFYSVETFKMPKVVPVKKSLDGWQLASLIRKVQDEKKAMARSDEKKLNPAHESLLSAMY